MKFWAKGFKQQFACFIALGAKALGFRAAVASAAIVLTFPASAER
jgi:hypothetical protein